MSSALGCIHVCIPDGSCMSGLFTDGQVSIFGNDLPICWSRRLIKQVLSYGCGSLHEWSTILGCSMTGPLDMCTLQLGEPGPRLPHATVLGSFCCHYTVPQTGHFSKELKFISFSVLKSGSSKSSALVAGKVFLPHCDLAKDEKRQSKHANPSPQLF